MELFRATRVFLAVTALVAVAPLASAEEEIRIAVARSGVPVSISGTDLVAEDIVTGEILARGKRVITLGADDTGLSVLGRATRATRVIVSGKDGVAFQGRTFQGRMEALFQKQRGRVSLLLVHPLPIERYLVGIVSGELPAGWPLEAMKAQAVAARTYAIYQKFHAPDRPYHLDSGVLDQVYGGTQRETALARDAVAATRGQVLTFHRRPIRAYFHACCAGKTESAREGWGFEEPYLVSVSCPFDGDCTRSAWSHRLTLSALGEVLQKAQVGVGPVVSVEVTKRTDTGRAAQVTVKGGLRTRQFHGEDLRRLVGYDKIRSRAYDVSAKGGELTFTGRGSGHGVGLCQWGARGMAAQGRTYDAILGHYYKGTRIQRMY